MELFFSIWFLIIAIGGVIVVVNVVRSIGNGSYRPNKGYYNPYTDMNSPLNPNGWRNKHKGKY